MTYQREVDPRGEPRVLPHVQVLQQAERDENLGEIMTRAHYLSLSWGRDEHLAEYRHDRGSLSKFLIIGAGRAPGRVSSAPARGTSPAHVTRGR